MVDDDAEAGIFLTLNDCTVLFPRLKGNESKLSSEERRVLHRIEKVLYVNLSIREMEALLERGAASSEPEDCGSNDA